MKKSTILATATIATAILAGAGTAVSADEVVSKPAEATTTDVATEKPAEVKTENVLETVKEKTQIEVEKVEKPAPEVQNPNPAPAEPKQPEFNPEVKKTENTVEKLPEAKGNSQIEFTAKSKTITNTESSEKQVAKPRKMILWMDRSSSFADKAGQNYIDTIANRIVDSMNEGDELAIVGNINTIDFLAPGQMINFQTLTSDKSTLKAVIAMKGDNGTASANPTAMEAARKVIGDKGNENLQDFLSKKDIVTLFGNGAKASDLTLINLLDDTAIDVPTSTTLGQIERFVKAGGNVLSYIPNVTKGQVDATERLMKQVGVKADNVEYVDYNAGNPNAVADTIIKSLNDKTVVMETKTTVTVIKQKGQVTVTADKGLNLTAVKLTSPSGKSVDLVVKDGKAIYSGELEDGKYTVTYTYTGEGAVTGTASVDGKEVAKKTDTLKALSGFVKVDYRSEDGKELKATTTLVEAGKAVSGDWKAPTPAKTMTKDGVTYVLTGIPSVENGKVNKDNTTLHYVYKAKPADKPIYTTTFKVVDAVTGKQIDGVFTVAKGFSGDAYSVKAPTVEGYQVTLKEGLSEGRFADKDVVLTYIAHEKGAEVKAIFVDEAGNELKDPEIISKAEELVGKEWKFETTVEKEITVNGQKYVLYAVPEVSEGKVTSDRQTLRFIYKKVEEPKKVEKPAPKAMKTLPKTSAVKVAPSTGKYQYVVPAVVAMASLASLGYAKLKREEK